MNRWNAGRLLVLGLLILPVAAFAFEFTRPIPVYQVSDSIAQIGHVVFINLRDYTTYLPLKPSAFDPEDILAGKLDHQFQKMESKSLDLDQSYWLRLDIRNDFETEDFYIRFHQRLGAAVYTPVNGGYNESRLGPLLKPWEKPVIFDQYALVPLRLPRGDTAVIYYRTLPVHEEIPSYRQVPPTSQLAVARPIDDLITSRTLKNSIFATIGLCMFFYNLMVFLLTREKIYIYYLLMVAFLTSFLTSIHFFSYIFTAFDNPRWMLVCLNASTYFLLLFHDHFLQLKSRHKPLHVLFKAFSFVSFGLMIPFLVNLVDRAAPYRIWEHLSIAWVMIVLILACYASIIMIRHGVKSTLYFLVANAIFFVTSFFAVFKELFGVKWGLIGYDPIYDREFVFEMGGIGMISQVVLYGLAIGHKMLILEKDKSKAIQEKLETQEDLNVKLEEKVSERTSQLEHRNKENELLLGEIHHRVKNNLQVISSLLKLQSRQLEEGKAKSAVLEGRDRVKAMALIHQRLYQQDQFSAIQMDDYVQNLVENLAGSYGFGKNDFKLELNIPEIQLDVDTAVPLGLIINELVSNSFKHAFKTDGQNQLKIGLEKVDAYLELHVSDNGSGIPPGFVIEDASSFGLQLIHALTQELNGSIKIENGQGTKASIVIHDCRVLTNEDA